jgi:hypothetical protein
VVWETVVAKTCYMGQAMCGSRSKSINKEQQIIANQSAGWNLVKRCGS